MKQLVIFAAGVGYAAYIGSLKLAQSLSPKLFQQYRDEMGPQDRLQWDGRLPSTMHAVAITAVSLHLFLVSQVFREDKAGTPFVLRTSQLSDAALGFSLGYFATDLILLVLHFPCLGGPELGLHHVAALASVGAAAFQGQAHAYTLALLATECTTPFVNMRYLLDKGGWRQHPVYIVNGMALLASWIVGRLVLFLYFFSHVYNHLNEFHLLTPLSQALIYAVPPTLFVLNCFWFIKIWQGAMKLLFGPRRKQRGGSSMANVGAAGGKSKEL